MQHHMCRPNDPQSVPSVAFGRTGRTSPVLEDRDVLAMGGLQSPPSAIHFGSWQHRLWGCHVGVRMRGWNGEVEVL